MHKQIPTLTRTAQGRKLLVCGDGLFALALPLPKRLCVEEGEEPGTHTYTCTHTHPTHIRSNTHAHTPVERAEGEMGRCTKTSPLSLEQRRAGSSSCVGMGLLPLALP